MKRRWAFAVLISTLFHLGLVAGVRALISRVHRQELETAPPPRQAQPSPTKLVEFIRIGLQPRAPAPANPASDASRPAAPTPGPGPGPAPSPHEATADQPGTEQAPSLEPSAQGIRSGEPQTALNAAPPGEPSGPSAEVMALVHERLAQGAKRCYPPAAQRFRQSGVVTVAFCATRAGGVERIAVDATSGSALLDQAATTCVVPGANPLPLEAAGACFRLPIRFGQ